jgi:hypothetical protein
MLAQSTPPVYLTQRKNGQRHLGGQRHERSELRQLAACYVDPETARIIAQEIPIQLPALTRNMRPGPKSKPGPRSRGFGIEVRIHEGKSRTPTDWLSVAE